MVNSANSECLLCGALARGQFVPKADTQGCHPFLVKARCDDGNRIL